MLTRAGWGPQLPQAPPCPPSPTPATLTPPTPRSSSAASPRPSARRSCRPSSADSVTSSMSRSRPARAAALCSTCTAAWPRWPCPPCRARRVPCTLDAQGPFLLWDTACPALPGSTTGPCPPPARLERYGGGAPAATAGAACHPRAWPSLGPLTCATAAQNIGGSSMRISWGRSSSRSAPAGAQP